MFLLKKIIIQGAGFADNFGDVLFYDIFLKESKEQNLEVELISITDKVLRHLPYQKNYSDKKNILSRVKSADGIVYIGGGYLGEPPNINYKKKFMWGLRTIKNILYIAPIGALFKKKIIVIGAGAGPITNPITRKLVKWLANYSEKTIVRDYESYDFLKKIGVNSSKLVETVDTALLVRKYFKIEENQSNEKSIVLHLSESPEESVETKLIMNDVNKFLIENPEYKLKAITDHNGGGQDKAIEYLREKYKNTIETHVYKNPEELINFLNTASVVITNKLHIAIVSSSLEKSVISVPQHTKVLRYFAQIDQSDRCIEKWKIKKGDVFSLLEKYHDKSIKLEPQLFIKAENNIKYFTEFVQK